MNIVNHLRFRARNFQIYYFIFIYSFFPNTSSIFAQKKFLKGYVITLKADTLFGEVWDRRDPRQPIPKQKIFFRNYQKQEFRFTPDEVKGYCLSEKNQSFCTLPLGIDRKMYFLEIVISGHVSLLAHRQITVSSSESVKIDGRIVLYPEKQWKIGGDTGRSFKSNLREGLIMPIEVTFYLEKTNNASSLMKWRPTDYKATAQFYFSKDKELMDDIISEKIIFPEIEKIVKDYNDYINYINFK